MNNSVINEILQSYTISEYKDTGLLIAEKKLILPKCNAHILHAAREMVHSDEIIPVRMNTEYNQSGE